jgi:hypothetical protein
VPAGSAWPGNKVPFGRGAPGAAAACSAEKGLAEPGALAVGGTDRAESGAAESGTTVTEGAAVAVATVPGVRYAAATAW